MAAFDRLVALENDSYVWLCAVNLLTSAIEALASFESSDRDGMTRFSRFVERYFGPDFRRQMNLDDPFRGGRPPAITPGDHLYRYFRSGLAHSFCIEWGGLLHAEEGTHRYLFENRLGPDDEAGLGIAPRELVADFRGAVDRYFAALQARQPAEPEYVQFNARFVSVFCNKMRPPTP
jgi:hypothetical protein